MALHGSISSLRPQLARAPEFSAALAYLADLLRAGSPVQARLGALGSGQSKKVELDGGTYVVEQVYETKPRADGFFESHRKYIDIQIVVEGEELIEVEDISRLRVRQPYQPDRDVILYDDVAGASVLRIRAGDAAIFHPADVHMPCLRAGPNPILVRKAVLKVPVPA